jgi:predicted nuclease of predicted toxin-antitoxin system
VRFLFDQDVPDDLAHVLCQLGHTVVRLREVLPTTAPDSEVLAHAYANQMIMITCNRDDFVALGQNQPHHGIIVVFRRKSRTAERAVLVRLIESAGEQGLSNNINFA